MIPPKESTEMTSRKALWMHDVGRWQRPGLLVPSCKINMAQAVPDDRSTARNSLVYCGLFMVNGIEIAAVIALHSHFVHLVNRIFF